MAMTEIQLLLCSSRVPPLKSCNKKSSNCSLPAYCAQEDVFALKALQDSNRGVNNLENPLFTSQDKKSQCLLS